MALNVDKIRDCMANRSPQVYGTLDMWGRQAQQPVVKLKAA